MSRRARAVATCAWLCCVAAPACSDDPSTLPASDTGDADIGTDSSRDTAGDAGHDAEPDDTEPGDLEDQADASVPDAPGDAASDTDSGLDADARCPLADPRAEGPRTILIGHPFGAEVATDGTEIRTLEIGADGEVIDVGLRVDMGFVPSRIAFSPDGRYAFVLGEQGDLATLAVGGPQDVVLLDTIELPRADYGDLLVHSDGVTLTVVGSNVDTSSGVSVVSVSCDKPTEGALGALPEGFLNVRLSESLAPLGPDRGVLLGGQAVFDPVDDDDIRLLEYRDHAWTQRAGFDIFMDFVGATRIAASPDGTQALIPNDVPFSNEGGQVAVLSIAGDDVWEVGRLDGLPDVTEALYSPDGRIALVTQTEPGRVKVLVKEGNSMELTGQEVRAGVAQQMASIARGPLAGLVLVPATSPADGPELVVLRMEGDAVTETQRLPLGRGYDNIPHAVAVQP